MKKQLSKIITLALMLGISTILVSASSLKASTTKVFEVDFDFQIENSQFSKGTYRITRQSPSVLILENLTEPESKVILGSTSDGFTSDGNTESKLVFHRYGDTYFLREVVSPSISAKIGLSKTEKNVRRASREKLAKVRITSGK